MYTKIHTILYKKKDTQNGMVNFNTHLGHNFTIPPSPLHKENAKLNFQLNAGSVFFSLCIDCWESNTLFFVQNFGKCVHEVLSLDEKMLCVKF